MPHRRLNPLTGEWVLVSPHRTMRPWEGQQEPEEDCRRPKYDQSCYLCPGNVRANGKNNGDYESVFVFDNDFPALLSEHDESDWNDGPLFQAKSESGFCKVICFSPRHDLSVPSMELDAVTDVVEAWKDEIRAARANADIKYVQVFENKGAAMGCSNPHPHCQIWASSSVPSIVSTEQIQQDAYTLEHGQPMLVDYVRKELTCGERIVYENDDFVVLVPYWAIWPFESMILPRAHRPTLDLLNVREGSALADAYQKLTQTYNGVFDCEFPYTMGLHQAPFGLENQESWQLHLHFYPPLLRSSTVKKFMVGYEMLASPQRDITAEAAAKALRHVANNLSAS